jgi:hypothetical protein
MAKGNRILRPSPTQFVLVRSEARIRKDAVVLYTGFMAVVGAVTVLLAPVWHCWATTGERVYRSGTCYMIIRVYSMEMVAPIRDA